MAGSRLGPSVENTIVIKLRIVTWDESQGMRAKSWGWFASPRGLLQIQGGILSHWKNFPNSQKDYFEESSVNSDEDILMSLFQIYLSPTT